MCKMARRCLVRRPTNDVLFAELKNQIGLRRLRLRRMRFVREQFYLAATVQNLKRLVRFLSSKPTPQNATA
jgi:hypothetical protein